jgi:hypothetical protein
MAVTWYRRVVLIALFAGAIWLSESYAHEVLNLHDKACRPNSICPKIDGPMLMLRFLGLVLALTLPAAVAFYWRATDRRGAETINVANAAATTVHPMTASTR